MPTRIKKLSPLLINQIAAGEVVTRPASVVKELLENAIDASATHIVIHIEQGGLGLIQVSDNGQGIHQDDMILAVTRHATSKLADVGQLMGIDSLGFRGEALASISAVSHFTLTSSQDNSGIGQQLSISGNTADTACLQSVVKSQGTIVSVRDLYFNVPARRAHLKSIATEFSHIEQVVQKIAVSFPNIHITLYHQNKLRFYLDSINNNQDLSTDKPLQLIRLEQALKKNLSNYAEPFFLSLQHLTKETIDFQQATPQITGWIFWHHNQQEKKIEFPKLIYINQRLVTDLTISQTIQKIARQQNIDSLGYALFFQLPHDWVNVNIHPSKQQVKIQQLANLLTVFNQALSEKLTSLPIEKTQQKLIENFSKKPIVHHQVQENSLKYHVSQHHTSNQNSSENAILVDKRQKTDDNLFIYQNILPIALFLDQQGNDYLALIHWQEQLYICLLNDILLETCQSPNISTINTWLQKNLINEQQIKTWLKKAIVALDEKKLITLMLQSSFATLK